jgi:hypothetical protein
VLERHILQASNGAMETEAPTSTTKSKWGTRKLATSVCFTIIAAACLLAFVGLKPWHAPIGHSVSVTFLGYRNGDTSDVEPQYRWGMFRITNGSRVNLICQRGELDVERAMGWSHESPSSLGPSYEQSVLEPGESIIAAIVAPSNATRWRNNFLFTALQANRHNAWKNKLLDFAERLPLSSGLKFWLSQWLFAPPHPHTVTSETLKL